MKRGGEEEEYEEIMPVKTSSRHDANDFIRVPSKIMQETP